MNKFIIFFLIIILSPVLCGCESSKIQTQTGQLGHRADKLKKYVSPSLIEPKVEINSNIIYLGKEYENNTFGPAKIKFVFEK